MVESQTDQLNDKANGKDDESHHSLMEERNTIWECISIALELLPQLGILKARELFCVQASDVNISRVVRTGASGDSLSKKVAKADRERDHWLVADYFRRCPVGYRRVEELPAALEASRKWPLLKDTLVHFRMFNAMWTPSFRFDLIRLWRLLGIGISTDGTAAVAVPKRQYDIVEEYNKSAQEWVCSRSTHIASRLSSLLSCYFMRRH